jgi:hypothetical protein
VESIQFVAPCSNSLVVKDSVRSPTGADTRRAQISGRTQTPGQLPYGSTGTLLDRLRRDRDFRHQPSTVAEQGYRPLTGLNLHTERFGHMPAPKPGVPPVPVTDLRSSSRPRPGAGANEANDADNSQCGSDRPDGSVFLRPSQTKVTQGYKHWRQSEHAIPQVGHP